MDRSLRPAVLSLSVGLQTMLFFVFRRAENMLMMMMMNSDFGKDRVWVEAQRLEVNSTGRPFVLDNEFRGYVCT